MGVLCTKTCRIWPCGCLFALWGWKINPHNDWLYVLWLPQRTYSKYPHNVAVAGMCVCVCVCVCVCKHVCTCIKIMQMMSLHHFELRRKLSMFCICICVAVICIEMYAIECTLTHACTFCSLERWMIIVLLYQSMKANKQMFVVFPACCWYDLGANNIMIQYVGFPQAQTYIY